MLVSKIAASPAVALSEWTNEAASSSPAGWQFLFLSSRGQWRPMLRPTPPLRSQGIMQNAHLTISFLLRPKLHSWAKRQYILEIFLAYAFQKTHYDKLLWVLINWGHWCAMCLGLWSTICDSVYGLVLAGKGKIGDFHPGGCILRSKREQTSTSAPPGQISWTHCWQHFRWGMLFHCASQQGSWLKRRSLVMAAISGPYT